MCFTIFDVCEKHSATSDSQDNSDGASAGLCFPQRWAWLQNKQTKITLLWRRQHPQISRMSPQTKLTFDNNHRLKTAAAQRVSLEDIQGTRVPVCHSCGKGKSCCFLGKGTKKSLRHKKGIKKHLKVEKRVVCSGVCHFKSQLV